MDYGLRTMDYGPGRVGTTFVIGTALVRTPAVQLRTCMNKWLLPFLFLFVAGTACAQRSSTTLRRPLARPFRNAEAAPLNVVKINVLSPFALTLSGFYERALTPHLSVQLGAFRGGVKYRDNYLRGYGFTPEVRYYFSDARAAPRGFYVGPFLRYQRFRLRLDEMTLTGDAARAYKRTQGEANPDETPINVRPAGRLTTWGGGAVVGYQAVFNPVTLDVFVGPGYASRNFQLSSGRERDFDYDFLGGLGLRFGVAVGVAF